MFYIYDTTIRSSPRRTKKEPQPTVYYCRHLHNYYKLKLHELEANSFELRVQARVEQELALKKMEYWYRQDGFNLQTALQFKTTIVKVYELERTRLTAGK